MSEGLDWMNSKLSATSRDQQAMVTHLYRISQHVCALRAWLSFVSQGSGSTHDGGLGRVLTAYVPVGLTRHLTQCYGPAV